ncbi:MAG: hypothetical protein JWO62_2544 [Acidimicrobiaceae bacterium]|nr:hypothetical protein [Acidimicrobiaceae bacterium]
MMELMSSATRSRRIVRPAVLWLCIGVLLAAVAVVGIAYLHQRRSASLTSNTGYSAVAPTVSSSIAPTSSTSGRVVTPPSVPFPVGANGLVSINHEASMGNLLLEVQEMECGVTQLGAPGLGLTAPNGTQWCLVEIKLSNVSSQLETFNVGGGLAFGLQQRFISPAPEAELFVSTPLLSLAPGTSAPDVVPFEISSTDRITELEFAQYAPQGGLRYGPQTGIFRVP